MGARIFPLFEWDEQQIQMNNFQYCGEHIFLHILNITSGPSEDLSLPDVYVWQAGVLPGNQMSPCGGDSWLKRTSVQPKQQTADRWWSFHIWWRSRSTYKTHDIRHLCIYIKKKQLICTVNMKTWLSQICTLWGCYSSGVRADQSRSWTPKMLPNVFSGWMCVNVR